MQLVPLREINTLLPAPVSYNTARNWCTRGYRGVRLEHTRLGCRIFVTPEAVSEFIAAVTDLHNQPRRRPVVPKRRDAAQACARARKALEAL